MKQLTILHWPGSLHRGNAGTFQREFGVKIEFQTISSATEIISRTRDAENTPDLITASDYTIRELVARNLLLELNHEQLPNLKHLSASFRDSREYDVGSHFSVIKEWGTLGFVYRSDIIDERLTSWADFWRMAERYSGKVAVFNSARETLGVALKMAGYSFNATSHAALEAAREQLLRRSVSRPSMERGCNGSSEWHSNYLCYS
jgi:spermidine/putrescine transport system substrate-binding protein